MVPQLRAAVPERSKRGDRDDLAVTHAEVGSRVEVAEREFDRHPRKIGRDFRDLACQELLERA